MPIGDPDIAITELLKKVKALDLGGRKHQKFRLPNGFTFVRPRTPSDHRSNMNSLHELRRLLGRAPWEK